VKHAPRPAARLLLAGRFLVPRATLLALPDGPVSGIDLATGALVGLSFGPGAGAADELESRIARWNGLAPPGSPIVRDLHWHLGRPLLVSEVPAPGGALARDRTEGMAGCDELADALAAAGLGLLAGPADVGLGPAGPYLRRPAIEVADPARPLGALLVAHVLRLHDRAPLEQPVGEPPRPARVRAGAVRLVPASRRARVALLVSCGLLSAFVASSVRGTSHGDGVAAAAAAPPPLAAPAALALPKPAAATAHVRVDRPVPTSRGGAARVLRLTVAPDVPRRVVVAPPAPARVVPRQREAGWVAGLFVGS
jgi:hypothetical protein